MDKMDNKQIDKMKTEIKQQNNFYMAVTALCLIALGTNLSGVLTSAYSNPHAASFVHGFILGLFIVVEAFVIMKFVKNQKALKDETMLRRLYNEHHDERSQQIEALAGQKGLEATILITVALGLIVCYFSLEAFLGMLAVIFVAGATRKFYKMYYNKTYSAE